VYDGSDVCTPRLSSRTAPPPPPPLLFKHSLSPSPLCPTFYSLATSHCSKRGKKKKRRIKGKKKRRELNSFDNLYEKSVPRFSIDVNAAPSRLSLRRASTAKKRRRRRRRIAFLKTGRES
jgi:hypothetical protein